MAVERVLSNLNLISFKTEGGLQNHIDELQDGDLVFTPDSSLKGNLFDFKWTDHKLNDISWLNADTFSWQSGDVYVAAYNHLVEDIDGRTTETETVGGVTISFYRAEDGHKICLADQESNILALYEATGVAWYYVIDTANKQFKLPRTKFGFTGLRDSVGKYVEAGLPNITGSLYVVGSDEATNWVANVSGLSGAFYPITVKTGTQAFASVTTNTNADTNKAGFDASRSNSMYGKSTTVQPKATQMYLYFYVGNFEREAIEQTAGLNAELFNDKADTDLSNLTSAGKSKIGPKIYRVTGKLINSIADTVEGYGVAEVYLYPNGFAKIEYSIQCTKSGSSTSYFQWGINSDLLTSKNSQIPKITPVGGTMTFYATNGNIDADRTGYGGILAAVSQFWQPGRVYNLDGGVGGWPAGNFAVNQRVVGTAWGTYEI